MTEVGRISIKVVPDLKEFREKLYSELKKVEEGAKVKVKADFDSEGLKGKVEAAAKGADAKAKVGTDVDTKGLKEKVAAAAKAAESKVKVRVEVERIRRYGNYGRPEEEGLLGRLAGRLPSPGLPNMGSIGNFGSPANLLAIFSLLPPALALITPVLTAIPAMVSAIAAPLGVGLLGKDGIMKALDESGLLSDKKSKSGKDKQSVAGNLKDMQDQVSKAFETGLLPAFQQLGGVLPVVTPMLTVMADSMSTVARSFAGFLTRPDTISVFGSLMGNISALIADSAPALVSFSTGILRLAQQVSTHFPGLSSWFDKLGDKFSGWVEKISSDGTLDKATASLGPIADSMLGFVGRLMDAGLKIAGDKGMTDSIVKVVNAISDLTIGALPALTAAFKGVASLLGGIANTLKSLGLIKTPETPPGLGKWWTNGDPSKLSQPQSIKDRTGKWPANEGGGDEPTWLHKLTESGVGKVFGGIGGTISDPTTLKNLLSLANLPLFALNNGGKIGSFLGNQFQNFGSGFGPAGVAHADTGDGTGAFNPGPMAPGAKPQAAGQQIQGQMDGVKQSVQSSMDSIVSIVQATGQKIINVVNTWPGAIASVLGGLRGVGESAGKSLGEGMAAGIAAGQAQAVTAAQNLAKAVEDAAKVHLEINSPSKKFIAIGESVGEGFSTGIEQGVPGVIGSAQTLVTQLQSAVQEGVFPAGLRQNVQEEMKAITQEYDQLRVQMDAVPQGDKAGRAGIKAQMDQLKTLRDQLKLGQDQLPDKGKGGDSENEAASMITKALAQQLDIGKSFVMANVNQFESDIGWSGKGAIPTLANIGIGWAQKSLGNMINGAFGVGDKGGGGDTHIHVNNVDEALQAKQNITNRQGLAIAGR